MTFPHAYWTERAILWALEFMCSDCDEPKAECRCDEERGECQHCDGSGKVTTIERNPGAYYGYSERTEPCSCGGHGEPDYDGPDDDPITYDGPAVDDWFRGDR